MSPDSVSVASTRSDPLYATLEERILARDQKGASEIYYGLVKSGRPLPEMLALDGSLTERLGQWMTLVHRGQVVDAYRVFLGLMANPAERRAALAELVFAGLIDVQDRSFQNRSYTTGHKSFRARATVELG